MKKRRVRLRHGLIPLVLALPVVLAASAVVVSRSAGLPAAVHTLLLTAAPGGACCREGVGTGCEMATEAECQGADGLYLGEGTSCASDVCSFRCVGAVGPLDVPSFLQASTEGGPPHVDPDAIDCDGVQVDGGGRWYTVVGGGRWVTVETCDAADFDTKLFVYSGDCSSLVCRAANDDACMGTRSHVGWCGNSARTYHIFVTGHGAGAGSYSLRLTEGVICEK